MALVAKRKLDATWREAVAARAREMRPAEHVACLERFDEVVRNGGTDAEAAYRALDAAGLLWSVDASGLIPVARPSGPHDVPSV